MDKGRIHPSMKSSEAVPASAATKPEGEAIATHWDMPEEQANFHAALPPSQDTKDDEEKHRPPMSVIVVSSPAAPVGMDLGLPSGLSSSRRDDRCVSSSSVFSTPFRLQPRNTLTVSTPGRDGAIRGRKRSAQSMSASKLGRDTLLTPKLPQQPNSPPPPVKLPFLEAEVKPAATPKQQPLPSGSTPPRATRRGLGGRVDNISAMNFQCLSLQSPKRKDQSPPPPKLFAGSPPQSLAYGVPNTTTSGLPPSSSSSSSGTAQRPAMVPGSVGSFQSAAGNVSQPTRSSFTPVYNSASPGGSMRSYGSGSIARAAAQSPSMLSSNCGGSAKSSPKIAPLTVLQDRGCKVPSRDNSSRLPPLPGGGMSSLWFSLESSQSADGGSDDNKLPKGNDDEAKMWPPRTVHCRKPSSDSISTVHNSVMSPLPRPSPRRSPGGAFSSPASAGAPKQASTPRSKQRRLDEYTSPSQRTPRTPKTPLPRVTLTPRSTGSRRSRQSGQGLPRFPSPSDVDMDVTSPFLNSAAAASLRDVSRTEGNNGLPNPPARRDLSTIGSFFPASSNSLALSADGSTNCEGKDSFSSATTRKKAPLPILDLSAKSPQMTGAPKTSGEAALSGGAPYMDIQTMSLLNSSYTCGVLQAMMEESASGGRNTEMGSVSDIDENEGFILASPSAIEEERFARCQPARQRRRRSCDSGNRFANHAAAGRGSPSLSPNASNTNLAGMNYVTSNTSLFGMDIAHPTDPAAGWSADGGPTPKTPSENPSMKKDGSLASDFGMLLASPQEMQTLKRRKSDASFDSIGLALEGTGGDGGRDLVTPPAMANPETPPPLSPKEGSFMPVVMPEGTVEHNYSRRQPASVCIAGADRNSVTMAIARMASEAQGHAESSPVL